MIGSWRRFESLFEARTGSSQRAICLFALLAFGCAAGQDIERRRGARVERGREVPEVAYAWYARGTYLEREGDLELARIAYEHAIDADPKSGAAWAGLGRVHCHFDRALAEATLARGLRRASEHVPLLLAQAECLLGWGEPEKAVTSAESALHLDPLYPQASDVLGRALEAAGKQEEAGRVRAGAKLYFEPSVALAVPAGARSTDTESFSLAAVDEALGREDLSRARTLALELMSPAELALRALALEKPALAREQALLVVRADPLDVTAGVVLTLLEPFEVPAPPIGFVVSPLLACVVAERIALTAGAELGLRFARALEEPSHGGGWADWVASRDPLLARCALRLSRFPATFSSAAVAPP